MASFVRTNFKIRVPEVRVIDATGKMLGVLPTRKAQAMAEAQGLDLVEITPSAQPPVCKIMDYGKFRYEESIKQKQARKNAKATLTKEIKFHASTDVGDINLKVKKILEFIEEGNKVKVTLMYRGRENAHRELGTDVIQQVIDLCAEKTIVEQQPKLLGRVLGCMLAPKPVKGKKVAAPAAPASAPAAPRPAAPRPAAPTAPAAPRAPMGR